MKPLFLTGFLPPHGVTSWSLNFLKEWQTQDQNNNRALPCSVNILKGTVSLLLQIDVKKSTCLCQSWKRLSLHAYGMCVTQRKHRFAFFNRKERATSQNKQLLPQPSDKHLWSLWQYLWFYLLSGQPRKRIQSCELCIVNVPDSCTLWGSSSSSTARFGLCCSAHPQLQTHCPMRLCSALMLMTPV